MDNKKFLREIAELRLQEEELRQFTLPGLLRARVETEINGRWHAASRYVCKRRGKPYVIK